MAIATHIYRRGAVYWWRRRYPEVLRRKIGLVEARISLRTHVRKVAISRAARLRLVTDVAFAELERRVFDGQIITADEAAAIVRDIALQELESAERERALRPPRGQAEVDQAVWAERVKRQELQKALSLGELSHVAPLLDAEIARFGRALPQDSDDYKLLQRNLARALLAVSNENEARELGQYNETFNSLQLWSPMPQAISPSNSHLAAPTSPSVLPKPESQSLQGCASAKEAPTSSVPLFSEVAQMLKEDNCKDGNVWSRKWNEQTSRNKGENDMVRKHKASVRLFLELMNDRPIDQYDHVELISNFRDVIGRLPSNHSKSCHEKRTALEVIEGTDRQEAAAIEQLEDQLEAEEIDEDEFNRKYEKAIVARLSATTINNHVRRVAAVFDFAIKRKLRGGPNPANGLALSKRETASRNKRRQSKVRLPWGPERLNKLFSSTAYTSGSFQFGDPVFLAPIIARLSGLREEEVLQLRLDDIELIDGVWCFVVREGMGRYVKNDASVRAVPIHQSLLDAGLIEYVEHLRALGKSRLFHSLKRGKANNKFSDSFSKRFSYYRKKEDLYDTQRDFHSLRKDFQVSLRESGVPWAARKRIMGHQISDMTDGTYDPEGESLAQRQEFVNRIGFGFRIEREEAGARLIPLGSDAG